MGRIGLAVALAALFALVAVGAAGAFLIVCGEGSQLCRGSDDADNFVGTTDDADFIRGEGGNDGIQGDPFASDGADDEIRGGGGADVSIDSLPANDNDTIFGGKGNDTINVRENEGGADTVNCGKGVQDKVFFDEGIDQIADNCEILNPTT